MATAKWQIGVVLAVIVGREIHVCLLTYLASCSDSSLGTIFKTKEA